VLAVRVLSAELGARTPRAGAPQRILLVDSSARRLTAKFDGPDRENGSETCRFLRAAGEKFRELVL
jgi:hypothetical protein